MRSMRRSDSARRVLLSILLALVCLCTLGCTPTVSERDTTPTETQGAPEQTIQSTQNTEQMTEPISAEERVMYIKAAGHTLTVAMEENSSADALLELLRQGDITVNAHDYGNFEKVGSLGVNLPTNDRHISIQPGDVILYQGNQITVYYDSSSWSLTRLGRVQGVTQEKLREILGNGSIDLTFTLDA